VDISKAIVMEHLFPAAKILGMIKLFVCLYAYLGGADNIGGWANLNIEELLKCQCSSSAVFIDMSYFVVRVFGRAVMVLKRREASMLFGFLGFKLCPRIIAFNNIVTKMAPTKWERLKEHREWTHSTPVNEDWTPEFNWRKMAAEHCSTAAGYVGHSKNPTDCSMKCISNNGEESPSEGRDNAHLDSNGVSPDKDSIKPTQDCGRGMTVGVCSKTSHNVQSVKLLINRIKEDIDCRFSAWETGKEANLCP
jgi:hypothetical protein